MKKLNAWSESKFLRLFFTVIWLAFVVAAV